MAFDRNRSKCRKSVYKLREQVLKALANPARIFYVPYSIAVLNFAIQFLVYIGILLATLIATNGEVAPDPLYFLVSLCAVHFFLMGYSKNEPQLANIISAKIQLWKLRVPKELRA